jgi:hypothetical protein
VKCRRARTASIQEVVLQSDPSPAELAEKTIDYAGFAKTILAGSRHREGEEWNLSVLKKSKRDSIKEFDELDFTSR